MTDSESQSSPPTNAERLLSQLRTEIAEEGQPSSAAQESNTDLDDDLAALLSQVTGNADVFAAADILLAHEEQLPKPAFQTRATQRVAAVLARRRQPLPALLESARASAGASRADIALKLDIVDERLRSFETGALPLWEMPESEAIPFVMRWIHLLQVNPSDAARAARRLLPPESAPAYARRNSADRGQIAEAFVTGLVKELTRIVDEGRSD
jgi:hypothetical protein